MKPKGWTAGSGQTGSGRLLETDTFILVVSFLSFFARPVSYASAIRKLNVATPQLQFQGLARLTSSLSIAKLNYQDNLASDCFSLVLSVRQETIYTGLLEPVTIKGREEWGHQKFPENEDLLWSGQAPLGCLSYYYCSLREEAFLYRMMGIHQVYVNGWTFF